MARTLLLLLLIISCRILMAQTEISARQLPKVSHAEPLFVDLIRDLGARKGEKEWNLGMGVSHQGSFTHYQALVEYEWAPVNRLGLEIELPFSIVSRDAYSQNSGSRLNAIKMSAQYTFFVSSNHQLSLATGYTHALNLTEFANYGRENLVTGHHYNPFLIIAKRWKDHWHTLLLTGPSWQQDLRVHQPQMQWEINGSVHYLLPQSKHFIGLEINEEISSSGHRTVLRPQVRLRLNRQLMAGLVTGIPLNHHPEGLGSFLRIIYEPR